MPTCKINHTIYNKIKQEGNYGITRYYKKRRSVRFFKPDQIKKEDLDKILEAGLWAPNARSRQAVKFVVVQNAKTNDQLGKINRKNFMEIADPKTNPYTKEEALQSAFYNAPTVIYLFTPNTYPNSIQDCCVASENMLLEATSLNVGSIYIARGEVTFSSPLGFKLKEQWGLSKEYECHSIVLLGYSSREITPKPRKENRIIYDN